jgi:hypothetical protein
MIRSWTNRTVGALLAVLYLLAASVPAASGQTLQPATLEIFLTTDPPGAALSVGYTVTRLSGDVIETLASGVVCTVNNAEPNCVDAPNYINGGVAISTLSPGSYTVTISGIPAGWELAGPSSENPTTRYLVAGSVESLSYKLVLQVTPASLCSLTRDYSTNTGIAASLCAKLDAVAIAIASGNTKAKAGALDSYVAAVQAQSGKALTGDQAATLTRLAQRL